MNREELLAKGRETMTTDKPLDFSLPKQEHRARTVETGPRTQPYRFECACGARGNWTALAAWADRAGDYHARTAR